MSTKRPSFTARKVALNVISLGGVPEVRDLLPSGIVDATAELLVASGAESRPTVQFARTIFAVELYRTLEWLMPGQFHAFAHRKAFFEQQVRAGIQAGALQILVLGAGYDTLALRLAPEFPDVAFWEIDHPATSTLKAKGIKSLGHSPNLSLISEDLSQKLLKDVLRSETHWDENAPTVILAEGLLMYLPPTAVEELFQQCAAVTGSGSRFAFSYIGRTPECAYDAGPLTGLILKLLDMGGEPWQWNIAPTKLEQFLQKNAWDLAPATLNRSARSGIEYLGLALH